MASAGCRPPSGASIHIGSTKVKHLLMAVFVICLSCGPAVQQGVCFDDLFVDGELISSAPTDGWLMYRHTAGSPATLKYTQRRVGLCHSSGDTGVISLREDSRIVCKGKVR